MTVILHNIYIFQHSSCPYDFRADLEPIILCIFEEDTLIGGPFNARHPSCSALGQNQRCLNLFQVIDNSIFNIRHLQQWFGIFNNGLPSMLPTNGNPSAPDISIVNGHIAPDCTWCTQLHLGSNHIPALIQLHGAVCNELCSRAYTNFRCANWPAIQEETEIASSSAPQPVFCSQGENNIRK